MDKNILMYALVAVVIVGAFILILVLSAKPNYNVYVQLSSNNSAITKYPFQTSYFTILVNNTGKTKLNEFVVAFFVNGTEQRYFVLTLPPASHETLAVNYTPESSGVYNYAAVADPGKLFNLSDRKSAQSTIIINVSRPEAPNIFSSIPNNNINLTQSFTLNPLGYLYTAALTNTYNITLYSRMFTPGSAVMLKLIENFYQGLYVANGAYANYKNGTQVLTVWYEGVVSPQLINALVGTFRFPTHTETISNETVYFSALDNRTSMCTFYDKGWTKSLTYYNNSYLGNCLGIVDQKYSPYISNVLLNTIIANPNFTHYQSGFAYLNSTPEGEALVYTNSSIGGLNIFQSSYGAFGTYIEKSNFTSVANAIATKKKSICEGLIYNNSKANVCSVYLIPSGGNLSTTYSLINTTELTPNYFVEIYSLVNNTKYNPVSAHLNGASLINALNISQPSLLWREPFLNSCSFNASTVGCNVTEFNYVNTTVSLVIKNNFNKDLKLNQIACYLPSPVSNTTLNTTLSPGAELNVTIPCYQVSVPVISARTVFVLRINATISGTKNWYFGSLNITHVSFG